MHRAGDAGAEVGHQVERGAADVGELDVAAQRRGLARHPVDVAGTADHRAGERPHRAGRDGVDAHALRAEVGREVAYAGLERGLGDTHHVVRRHDPRGALVGQRHQAAAVGHQRQRAARDLGERVAGDRQAALEVGLGGVDVAALQLLLVGKGDGVHDEVDLAPLLLQAGEQPVEALLALDVGLLDDLRAQLLDHRQHALAEGRALVGEGHLGAGGVQRLRDAPGDRAIVGDAHDQAALALHQPRDGRKSRCLRGGGGRGRGGRAAARGVGGGGEGAVLGHGSPVQWS